jgi:hypothetical protein
MSGKSIINLYDKFFLQPEISCSYSPFVVFLYICIAFQLRTWNYFTGFTVFIIYNVLRLYIFQKRSGQFSIFLFLHETKILTKVVYGIQYYFK